MFGGTTFLGQYFQVAQGYSPTKAGLMTIPLMVAAMLSSTIAGQIISRTGRWKAFLVGGGIFLVAGLAGLSLLRHDTPALWRVGVSMAVMGLGMGALMQNLVLAVQNTVDVRDIGAASATVSFFRSLGGAVGVSALGAVLASLVQSQVHDGLATSARRPPPPPVPAEQGRPRPRAPAAPVIGRSCAPSYGDATGQIFLVSAVVAVVALLCVVFISEVPLRTTVKLGDSAENTTAGVAGTASPAERSPEVTATAGPSDTPRASHTSGSAPCLRDGRGQRGDRRRRRPPRPGGQPRADPGLLRPAGRPGRAHGGRRPGRPHRGAGHRPAARHGLP